MIDFYALFFSPVYQIIVPDGLPALDALKEYEYIPAIAENSHTCYITKSTSVLDDFPKEKQIILNYFYKVKNEYLRHESTDFKMTSSWGTRAEQGSQSQYHYHANNFYSGVFYFDEYADNAGPIMFESPLQSQNFYSFKIEEYNLHNARTHSLNLRKNTLIFFPSYLKHKIGLHLSEKPRYSIAFNFHPTGEYGFGDSLIRERVS